jgi:hypothetical protein
MPVTVRLSGLFSIFVMPTEVNTIGTPGKIASLRSVMKLNAEEPITTIRSIRRSAYFVRR